jgi:hypothetical protein
MTFKLATQHFPIVLCSVLALTSLARAQTYSSPGTQNSGAGAERLTYGVDAGLGETDNVTFAHDNKVTQTMATVDADFDVKHRSRRLDVDAKGDFSYFDYLQSAFGSQLVGRFDGVAHVALIPQRLTWVFQDDFGQASVDPFVPTTPGNLENINYFSTGPDLHLRLGGTGFFDLGARYARAQYATSPFNSNRYLGTVGAGLQLSARSSVSLNGAFERVMFENTLVNGDFDRSSAYARYEIQGARTGLSVELGATKITQDGSSGRNVIGQDPNGLPITYVVTIPQSASSTTGPLARIALTRRLSTAASLTLSGGRELTDGGSSFSGIQAGAIGVVGTASSLLTSSSYTSDFASVGWDYKRNRTTVRVSGRWERDVYPGQPQLDLTRGGVEFLVGRKLTRALTLQAVGRYGKNNYVNATPATLQGGSPKFDDVLIAGALVWRHGRSVELKLRAEHSERTNSTVVDNSYGENRVFLTIGYRPKPEGSDDSLNLNDSPAQ